MINILVTGGNGQLASCIKDIENQYDYLNFIYTDYLELDITNIDKVLTYFNQSPQIDYCINCAAHTAVDKAETEEELANKINSIGVKNLAENCKQSDTTLIHISTDFVFEGSSPKAYSETDLTNPLSVYGNTKHKGEQHIININPKHFILRTSWLYSEHGNNFMKIMLKLAKEKDVLNIIEDQIGTPTYATDLAEFICKIIVSKNTNYGLYHYSNEGLASWYDFAKAIFDIKQIIIKTIPIKTEAYPKAAKRPVFSVLDKTKIKNTFNIEIPYWRDSLKIALSKYNE